MKLSNLALLALKGMNLENKKRVADEMGLTMDTFYRWLRTNDEKLTMAACTTVIKKEFGLTDEQILEAEKVS